MMDADAEGFTVAVVASKRLFKDAAADPTFVPSMTTLATLDEVKAILP